MANQLTLARPYARALFKLAAQHDQLTLWQQSLQVLGAIASHPVTQQILLNPIYSAHEIKTFFVKIVTNFLPKKNDEKVLTRFLELLIQEKRVGLLPDIYVLFQRLKAEHESITTVEVVSAHELSKQQQHAIHQALEKRFASKVTIDYTVDDTLIGGALVRAGNWVMDGSVKGKVTRLTDEIMA